MSVFEITKNYEDEKLYNIIDEKEKFIEYFNMSLDDLIFYFGNYYVIDKKEITNFIKKKYNQSLYLEQIITNRELEYDYYQKVLTILSTKALAYLSLLKYLCNCKEKNNSNESILEEIEVYHYISIVTGKDIKRILIVLYHILKNFNDTLDAVNKKENFLHQRYSSSVLNCGEDELYPSDKLILIDSYCLDKTSLNIRRKVK